MLFIEPILNSPVTIILLYLGIALLIFTLLGGIKPWVKVPPANQKYLLILGVIFIIFGIAGQIFIYPDEERSDSKLIENGACASKQELIEAVAQLNPEIQQYRGKVVQDEVMRDYLLLLKQRFQGYIENETFCEDVELQNYAKQELTQLNRSI